MVVSVSGVGTRKKPDAIPARQVHALQRDITKDAPAAADGQHPTAGLRYPVHPKTVVDLDAVSDAPSTDNAVASAARPVPNQQNIDDIRQWLQETGLDSLLPPAALMGLAESAQSCSVKVLTV